MQLIKPASISGEIMNIIDEAKESLIIVSPYNNFSNWHKLKSRLEKAIKRNINIQYFVRKPERSKDYLNVQSVAELGIKPIEIPYLHCKLYLNESVGLVTSMNLLHSSDEKAIDIGYKSQTVEEYKELIDFINNYLLAEVQQNQSVKNVNKKSLVENFSEEDTDYANKDIVTDKMHGFAKKVGDCIKTTLNKEIGIKVYSKSLTVINHDKFDISVKKGKLLIKTSPSYKIAKVLKEKLERIKLPNQWDVKVSASFDYKSIVAEYSPLNSINDFEGFTNDAELEILDAIKGFMHWMEVVCYKEHSVK